jgi:gas vesicle protein
MDTQERIAAVEKRVVTLTKSKEAIVGKIAVEEQNKKRAMKELSDLGYDVEELSVQEIKELQEKLQAESEKVLAEIEETLEKAETLVSKFKEL